MIDIKLLIDWLGVNGAKEGIKKSSKLTVNELKNVADQYGLKYKSKITRNDLINLIILKFDKRIDKSFEELMDMRAPEIAEYLDNTNCTREEIMELLNDNNIPFKKSLSRIGLIHYVADEISNIGVFKRISENEK
ncbi:hypothetical protein GT646_18905 [Clostridium butyricum]|uniref:hypothetical protein n=1 Tax=Clostridium butyricum TaxID=1492 RepID=UPI00136F8B1E|nr:hypothetical protein [Clostridium butyricum]MZI82913.1 hypothetical protein [Clostridium butyricum]